MKHYTNILLAVFLTASLNAAAANPQTADYTFTIHIGGFINAKLVDFENIRPFGYIYAQRLNNLTQVYMGDYPSESKANTVLNNIKSSGYPDAFVTRRSLSAGEEVSVIQLGSEKVGVNIDWSKYASAGPLHTFQAGTAIRIVTGPFNNLDDAQTHLKLVKQAGYSDAFIKNINSVLLHKVTSFETGGAITPPQNFTAVEVPTEDPEEEVLIEEIPPQKSSVIDVMVKKGNAKKEMPKEENIPTTYETVVMSKPKTGQVQAKPVKSSAPDKMNTKGTAEKAQKQVKALAIPSIRSKVKRTSVLRLQEVLKTKGTYNSGLDGYYGPGTQKSYDNFINSDREIQKYKLIGQLYEKEPPTPSAIEEIIFDMGRDITGGVAHLRSDRSAISKAYQAYGIFVLAGKNKETDKLMNDAIQASFANQKSTNKAPFDHHAKYAYTDYKQLIQHIRYIHGASKEKVAVPCWLFEKHPEEARAAFNPTNELSGGDYTVQNCTNIMTWESLATLETILQEMTPDLSAIKETELNKLQAKRTQLLISPKALDLDSYKTIDQWNKDLWAGLEEWEKTDPLHTRVMTPLRVTYHKSWALIEDHLMNKGLEPKEARGLSLCIMKTVVEPYLGRYSK